MKIRLIAVGSRMPAWVEQGYADYARRLPREWKLELIEIPAADRSRIPDPAKCREQEAAKILKALRADDEAIALDERGELLGTGQWAQAFGRVLQDGRDLAMIVGGPDGLAPAVLERARRTWSLSRLTLPHALVRVLLAEQIYRAWTRLANHPYHRG